MIIILFVCFSCFAYTPKEKERIKVFCFEYRVFGEFITLSADKYGYVWCWNMERGLVVVPEKCVLKINSRG
jgi:hypothetical protein